MPGWRPRAWGSTQRWATMADRSRSLLTSIRRRRLCCILENGPTYSEGEHRCGAGGESRGAGLLVRRGPWLQLQRSGELQRGSGEAGEGALAEVSEEASGVDFPYDLFSLMWSSPLHVLHLGQGRARAGLYRATLCRGAERRPGLVARRGDTEVTGCVPATNRFSKRL